VKTGEYLDGPSQRLWGILAQFGFQSTLKYVDHEREQVRRPHVLRVQALAELADILVSAFHLNHPRQPHNTTILMMSNISENGKKLPVRIFKKYKQTTTTSTTFFQDNLVSQHQKDKDKT